MKNTKRLLTSLLCLMLIASLFAGVATPVHAEETRTYADIALIDGFFCLHPHRKTPTPDAPVRMEGIPSTEYTGYSQDILDRVAAAVLLRGEYHMEKEIYVENGTLQSVIWATVCPEKAGFGDGLLHLNGRSEAQAYYDYVMANYENIKGKYVMTIWESPYYPGIEDPEHANYQDILEARLVEKRDVPSVEKKVLDWNDSNGPIPDPVGWQDSADHDIGDSIPFQITAQLHDLTGFRAYYLEFRDQMTHLTLDTSSLRITIYNPGDTQGIVVTDDFEVTWDANTKKLNIKCDNILPLGAESNCKVVVDYNATLDSNANIGEAGNPNVVDMVYSRASGTADRGVTPEDKVTVFTYDTMIHKVDQDGNALTGAAFELQKLVNGSWVSLGVQGAAENEDGSYSLSTPAATDFYWKGLDDGTYRFVEIVTPTGYNTIEPLEFTVTAYHDHVNDNPQLRYMNTSYPFDDTVPPEWIEYMGDYFAEYGLQVPSSGYTLIPGGTLEADIENKTGTTLPETGGMGTAPIYMAAVVMMFSAAALLLKKRSI